MARITKKELQLKIETKQKKQHEYVQKVLAQQTAKKTMEPKKSNNKIKLSKTPETGKKQ